MRSSGAANKRAGHGLNEYHLSYALSGFYPNRLIAPTTLGI